MRALPLIFFFSLLASTVVAQNSVTTEPYRYYKFFEDEDEPQTAIISESESTSSGEQNNRPRTSILNQNSAVINHYRGVGYYQQKEWFEGLEIPKLNINEARRIGLLGTRIDELSATYYTIDTTATQRTDIGLNISTRNYLAGITASTRQSIGSGWLLNCSLNIRTGTDSHIKGVFTNSAAINTVITGAIDSKSSILLALLFNPSERGTRKASFAEAFALTSDNYYNPAWGYQGSKVRNANTTTTLLPTAIASYSRKIDPARRLNIAVAATIGRSAYSNLDWLGGATPLPDNYRYLPSYFSDQATAEAVSNAWQRGDSRYTQINFDELHRRNALQPQSIYILANRVTRSTDLQMSASITRQINKQLNIRYGLKAQIDRTRNFKQVADLLSGGKFEDIDFFLVDDDAQINMLVNNLNAPNRTVGVSDRYGYDYALTTSSIALYSTAKYTVEKLSAEAYLQLGNSNTRRRGFFCKELFADNSYGASKTLSFADLAARIALQYIPNPKHCIMGSAAFVVKSADGQDLFLQTEYNNLTVSSPAPSNLFASTLSYRLHTSKVQLNTTLFARYHSAQTEVAHSYYDAKGEYADIITQGLATVAVGIEAEVVYNITKHWSVTAAAIYGHYRYAGKPTVTVYSDKDNTILAQDSVQGISSLRTGTTPELSAVVAMNYYNRGWGVNLSGGYYALRYVVPSLVRRTESILSHTTTPEQRLSLTSQERLPDAVNLDLSLSKSIYLKSRKIYANSAAPSFTERHPRSKITIFVAVNNLLGSRNTIYRGYESSRIRAKRQWDDFIATPFASYYLYAYPRTYFVQVRFSF